MQGHTYKDIHYNVVHSNRRLNLNAHLQETDQINYDIHILKYVKCEKNNETYLIC